MPGLVRSRPPEPVPAAARKQDKAGALGSALREMLMEEQSERLDAILASVIEKLEQQRAGLDGAVGGAREDLAAARADLAGVAKALEGARSSLREAIDSVASKVDAAVKAHIDDRMGDVVRALVELRASVMASNSKTPKAAGRWEGSFERKDGQITKIVFVHREAK